MRKRSYIRQLGWAVVSVAAGAFVALPAMAEPPSHGFTTRAPRHDVQRPHKPHVQHKPPPEAAPTINDHPPHVVHNVGGSTPSTVRTHIHKQPTRITITHAPRGPRKTHTINFITVQHQKTIKKHTK